MDTLMASLSASLTVTGRFAATNATFGGRGVRRVDSMVFLLGSGNRDPEAVEDPDRLDVTALRGPQAVPLRLAR